MPLLGDSRHSAEGAPNRKHIGGKKLASQEELIIHDGNRTYLPVKINNADI